MHENIDASIKMVLKAHKKSSLIYTFCEDFLRDFVDRLSNWLIIDRDFNS